MKRVLTIKAVNAMETKDLGFGIFFFMSRFVWQSCLRLEDLGHQFLIIIQDTVEGVKEAMDIYTKYLISCPGTSTEAHSGLEAHQHWKTKHFSNKVHKLNEVRFGYSVIEETWGIASCCGNWEQILLTKSMLKGFHSDRNMALAGVLIFLG